MTAPSETPDQIAQIRLAAEDGEPESMFLLGVAYAQGKGIERNDTLAARWFHEAARKGHARARTSMGYLYSKGQGVRHDPILAYHFLTQATEMGDSLAADMLTRLKSKMTPEQIKEAERRVKARNT